MKNTFGQSLSVTLFGESHGPYIGAVLDGLAPGMDIDEDLIKHQLLLRRPSGKISTSRVEQDEYILASGVFNGKTTGTPLSILIPNSVQRSSDYENRPRIARPGHADYTASVKYHGYEDFRGGGHFSGRITAAIVAAGAIALQALGRKGISLGTHILNCAGVSDAPFETVDGAVLKAQIDSVNAKDFPVLDDVRGALEEKILAAKADGDSVGGTVQTAIQGLPAGVGEPWFSSLEGAIANAVFSIGGVKGVEFGSGFGLSGMRGSQAADEFCLREGEVRTRSNHNGGINGGISNGMPVVFNAAVKPTPSISRPQNTVDCIKGEEACLSVTGRHDPAIVRRICIVITSLTAIVLCDQLALRFGTDYLR